MSIGRDHAIFLDEWESGKKLVSGQEDEANQWSRNFLIPSTYQSELESLKSKSAVTSFAQKLGIHPGIVVGRLQHERVIKPSWMNQFKERI